MMADMDLESFRQSLAATAPPPGLSQPLQALWWDAKQDWKQAHECVQADDGTAGAWVHAYLHRREGDLANAGYWYRRAGQVAATNSLEDEWTAIARALLVSR
jgi:hypothetical protein